uniref:BioF2-like acetyltransferase domain-containing protein n=1 Tax=viral metagenome TaxID=1070528 RepID=A0A6M3LAB9_9ZZZZ
MYYLNNYEISNKFDNEEWDSFVRKSSRNGTLFHTRKFLGYHKDKFNDCSLTIRKSNKLIAVLPIALADGALFSHPGSSFGGVVLSKSIGLYDVLNIFDCISYFLRREKISKISIRATPSIYNKYPCEEVKFVMINKGYILKYMDLCCTIDLTKNKLYKESTYRNINKAKNNNVIIKKNDTNFKDYWNILSDNLKTKYGVSPTHTLNEILLLKSLFDDEILLYSCYFNKKMIGGIVVFIGNSNAFETFYIAQDYTYQYTRGLSLLIDTVVEDGVKSKFKFCNLGVSTEDSGNIINGSLVKFKETFGARGIVRETYSKEILL